MDIKTVKLPYTKRDIKRMCDDIERADKISDAICVLLEIKREYGDLPLFEEYDGTLFALIVGDSKIYKVGDCDLLCITG